MPIPGRASPRRVQDSQSDQLKTFWPDIIEKVWRRLTIILAVVPLYIRANNESNLVGLLIASASLVRRKPNLKY